MSSLYARRPRRARDLNPLLSQHLPKRWMWFGAGSGGYGYQALTLSRSFRGRTALLRKAEEKHSAKFE
jgi:hypothetical protein